MTDEFGHSDAPPGILQSPPRRTVKAFFRLACLPRLPSRLSIILLFLSFIILISHPAPRSLSQRLVNLEASRPLDPDQPLNLEGTHPAPK